MPLPLPWGHSDLVVSVFNCSMRGPRIKPMLQTVQCFREKPLQYTALGMACTTLLTQPSALCGTVKWISALSLSNNTNGDGWMFGLQADWKVKFEVWPTSWAATWRQPTFTQMIWVNSCNGTDIHDSTINIILEFVFMAQEHKATGIKHRNKKNT